MTTDNAAAGAGPPSATDRMIERWNRFWFTPRDPTVLGLMRICCGLITLYTVFMYSLNLQEFFGEHAWWDLQSARRNVHDKGYQTPPLSGRFTTPMPANEFQEEYTQEYKRRFGDAPPAPYPVNKAEAQYSFEFRQNYTFDFRAFGLPFPTTPEEEKFLLDFARDFKFPPAPPYPTTKEEVKKIRDYVERYGVHPNAMYARGTPVWSIYFHVTDPTAMAISHGCIVLATFLFTIGFCTRITSVLTWLGQLFYIHRCTQVLFGVDTMMTILLVYLMIGPSGAALSVDRRIARWWSKARPRVIGRWRAFWSMPAVDIEPGRRPSSIPEASVSANVAIRLLQIHVCFIYLGAGLSKLLGQAWWNGTAVWGTIANYEFAPMQYEIYNWALRFLGTNQLAFMLFLTIAGYFTLTFEIGYTFLIWRPSLRWIILGMAITLHGFIGLFMGLKTFSLMMLVMNMAFLRTEEALWLVDLLPWHKKRPAVAAAAKLPEATTERAAASAKR
jgi:hypothetical protein